MSGAQLGGAAGAGAGEPDRGDSIEHVAYAVIRHMTGIEPGRAACGYSLGLHSGGEVGGGLPNLYWEEQHNAIAALALLAEVTRHGSDSVCRPCALYAAERLQDRAPVWAQVEETRLETLEGSWEPYTLD